MLLQTEAIEILALKCAYALGLQTFGDPKMSVAYI
jgi:hypothetical protein